MPKIAVFDFDGTIYNKDSLFSFWKFILIKHPWRVIFIGHQVFYMILHKLKIISAKTSKEQFLIYLYNLSPEKLDEALNRFWEKEYPGYFNNEIIRYIEKYNSDGVETICISASPTFFLKKICETLHIKYLIGTEINFSRNHRIRIQGENCRGKEKIKRLHEHFPKNTNDIVFAISDNSDDRELIQLATKGILL